MANLMLVQCVIASHAEVWTYQFWWKFYQELTVTMVQVPERMAVSTQGQHYVQLEEGHAYLYALIWLFTFCKLGNFILLDLASIKTLLACSILGGEVWKSDFF